MERRGINDINQMFPRRRGDVEEKRKVNRGETNMSDVIRKSVMGSKIG